MIYLTSDTHFGHKNIVDYCGRPYRTADGQIDVPAMNEDIVARWNSKVQPGDTVYHLGDFAMGPEENLLLRKRLNGKIILITGNHDWKNHKKRGWELKKLLEAGIDEVHYNLTLEMDGLKLYLAHIPAHIPDPFGNNGSDEPRTVESFPHQILAPPPADYDYFICGHVHDKWSRQGKTINAGWDVSNYYPITLTELLKRDNA